MIPRVSNREQGSDIRSIVGRTFSPRTLTAPRGLVAENRGDRLDMLEEGLRKIEKLTRLAVHIHMCRVETLKLRKGDYVIITTPEDATKASMDAVESFLPDGIRVLWKRPQDEFGILRYDGMGEDA